MADINNLVISYPDFQLNAVIDPEQFDTNNDEIVTKVNEIISATNSNTNNKADKTEVEALSDLVDAKASQTEVNNLTSLVNTKASQSTLNALSSTVDTKASITALNAVDAKADTKADATYVNNLATVLATKANTTDTTTALAGKADKTSVYTKDELDPWIRGGDTLIIYEVFTIVNSNNGAGGFTYKDKQDTVFSGGINAEGQQVFELKKGNYTVGQNMIEAVINDTLQRSVASGGLVEIDNTHVALTSPEANGAEITFKYYQKIGVAGSGMVVFSQSNPGGGVTWFKEL